MKKLFLDTNFVVDYLFRDEYKQQSAFFLEQAAKHGCKFYISYLTVANFAYIVRKLPTEYLLNLLTTIHDLFEIISNDATQISKAISLKPKDFEDALQYQAAISVGCGCIITRNEKDFPFSIIPVLSPQQFMTTYFN